MRINPIDPIYRNKQKRRNRAEEESEWFRYGTDKDFQAWCRTQPSAYSGNTDKVIFAHYRTSKNSGTATKPYYSGIPLTYMEHLEQHQVGQYNFMEKLWWEKQVFEHLMRWAMSKKHLIDN